MYTKRCIYQGHPVHPCRVDVNIHQYRVYVGSMAAATPTPSGIQHY